MDACKKLDYLDFDCDPFKIKTLDYTLFGRSWLPF